MSDFLVFNAAFPAPQCSRVLIAAPARVKTKQHAAKAHLKTIGMTQRQVAARLNISESYLNRVLNGDLQSHRLVEAVLALKPKK